MRLKRSGLFQRNRSAFPRFNACRPAKIAGCREIILCSPPDQRGKINDVILYTAKLCGVTKIFKTGGVQAIGAMAFGTETVPLVYKIFGPGNQFVTEAKQQVSKFGTAIDMPAGPSEVAVWADNSSIPEFVAADLLSQAEHGVDSQVLLVSTDEKVITETISEVDKQILTLPRGKLQRSIEIQDSLSNNEKT